LRRRRIRDRVTCPLRPRPRSDLLQHAHHVRLQPLFYDLAVCGAGFFQGEYVIATRNALCRQPALRRLADANMSVLGCLVARNAWCFQPGGLGTWQLALRKSIAGLTLKIT
jgi:hypothetical protein